MPGGEEAVRLSLTERYLDQVSHLASRNVKVLLPADLTNLDGMLRGLGLDVAKLNGQGHGDVVGQPAPHETAAGGGRVA
jgi:hypothetical protein